MTFSNAKILVALVAAFGLLLQFPLLLETGRGRGQSDLFTISNFFSYFTILANILVAVSPRIRSASFEAALAVYIAVVGITYSLLLRQIWNPQGWNKVADMTLHDVVPPLYVLAWLIWARKERIPWGDLRWWLLFPLGYFFYSMLRGAWLNWYPYPFLDAGTLGYPQTLWNAGAVMIAFVALSAAVIAWSRKRAG